MEEKIRKRDLRGRIALFALAALLLTAAVGLFAFTRGSTLIAGQVYDRDCRELDLRGQRVSTTLGLLLLRAPERLDLRGCALRAQQGLALRERFPACEIRWDIPLSAGSFDSDSQTLTLEALRKSDIPALCAFPRLRAVDAAACTDAAALDALEAALPALALRRGIALAGESWLSDAPVLTLDAEKTDCAALEAALPRFSALQRVELRGAAYDTQEKLRLAARYPAVEFIWPVELAPGHTFDTDARDVSLAGVTGLALDALGERLRLFPRLELLDLTGCGFTDEALLALRETLSGTAIRWDTMVCGIPFSTDAQEIDISGCLLRDVSEVEDKLPCFYRLERVVMSECGVSDEEMDALDQRHEDVRFIWTVHFGAFFLRTDAQTFIATTFPYGYSFLTNRQLQTLQYCRDLTALDIGHMYYTDVSFLWKLPKLKYLILADTGISDISWAENMPELYYLELFLTDVRDLTPLLACKNLRHLNLSWTHPDNPELLAQMTWLERLWLPGAAVSYDTRRVLNESLTNTRIQYGSGSSTGGTWRTDAAYFEMRDVFGAFYMEG